MWLLLVPVCLVIFSSSPILASEPHYVITVPTLLEQGAEEKACVTFLDLKEEVDIKLELKKDDQVYPVAKDKISPPDYSHCYAFQAPSIKEDKSLWRLHVSIHGEHMNEEESKIIVIFKVHDVCMIQTDRSTYKPGDIVQFHIVTVNHDFQATSIQYPLVELIDPNQQRIGQWLDVSTTQGFADLSFHLAKELAFGNYKINIANGCYKGFKVDTYTPKRFEFNIKTPSHVDLTDKSFHLDACGSYIYGKPVEGFIDLSVCPEINYQTTWHTLDSSEEEEDKSKCIQITKKKTDSKGCVSRDIQLGHFNFSNTERHHYLEIKSELTEEATGFNEKASHIIDVSSASNTIEFVDCEAYYQTGFPYHGKVKITNQKKQPMANQAVFLYKRRNDDDTDSNSTAINLVTDSNGIAEFTVKTDDWKLLNVLRARLSPDDDDDDDYHRHPEEHLYIIPIYSKSGSLMSIREHSKEVSCNSEQSVMVEYDIHKKNIESDTDHLHFLYMLLTKNGIFSYKEHDIDVKDQANSPNLHGSFPLKFHVHEDFFPVFELVVFSILPNGETIARTTGYDVSPCVHKAMKFRFSEEQVRPGKHVNLEVTADPGSLCSVRSVDKGFLIEMPHDDSDMPSDMTAALKSSIYSYQYTYLTVEPDVHQCPENMTAITDFEHIGVSDLFRKVDLHIFSNTHIKAPTKCVPEGVTARQLTTKKLKPIVESSHILTRSHFPDTWMFKLVPVGSDGHTVLSLTTPHSITKWVTDGFCLDKTGFADVKDVELTTFQPYFIDLIVPYSVVQGEKLKIQAVVYSFQRKCIVVAIGLAKSEDLVTAQDLVQHDCICEKNSKSFSWDISALKTKELKIRVDSISLELKGECTGEKLLMGADHKMDSVVKTIVVKPKGYEDENTKSFLLFPSDNREAIAINIDTPERLVLNSERAHVIILGDLLANVAGNLDNLLFYLPDGCGEQNAAKMSIYVCTLNYLESIKELKPEMKTSATEVLLEGYQKQLTFKNKNGSYTLFPGSDENIWLTAFSVRALSGAKKFIYVNDDHIQEAVNWLHTQQRPNGCFRQVDSYFNNYIDADDEISRTAYVTIALLENHVAHNERFVQDALSCLKKSVDDVTSVHTQALLAYVFTLAGDHELRNQMLQKLEEKAVKKEGTKHWETSSYSEGEVEAASYVILALLSEKPTTMENLADCVDIVRWIVAHQNPWGGFFSSQDTTIALQAMAMYADAIQHKKGDSTVTITSKSGFQKIVHVDKRNSLLVQTVDLPDIPGEYTCSVTGDGFVYLQSHVHYHAMPKHDEKDYFSVNVSTEPSACTHASQKRFDVHVDVRYSGKREHTNMAIITVETGSGYVPDRDSVKKLKKNPLVQRTEIAEQNITIYLDQLTHETVSFVFTVERDFHIENQQPANVIVYDYYDPDEYTVVDYNAPCSSFVAHCAVDAATREDCGFAKITKEQCEERGCCYDSSISETKWCFLQGFKKAEDH